MKMSKTPKYFSLKKAREIQRILSLKIVKHDTLTYPPNLVAGVDVAYVGDMSIGAAVLLKYSTLEILDKSIAVVKTTFPYIPTLLSFRELRPAIQAILKLHSRPEVLMVDAHGYAHPYRLGFASHLGVSLKIPTIGVAKKLLCGRIGEWTGNRAYIYHGNEIIGAAVRTKSGSKPIYISIGNMISLETAIRLVLDTVKHGNVLPEPTRQAHLLATKYRRKLRSLSSLKEAHS